MAEKTFAKQRGGRREPDQSPSITVTSDANARVLAPRGRSALPSPLDFDLPTLGALMITNDRTSNEPRTAQIAELRRGHLPLNVSPSDPPVVFQWGFFLSPRTLVTAAGIENSRRLEDRGGDETGGGRTPPDPPPSSFPLFLRVCSLKLPPASLLPLPPSTIPPSGGAAQWSTGE